MKRLIKLNNNNLNNLISDLATFISKGIEGINNRESLNNLIDNILLLIPDVSVSGTFFRGLILNEDEYDFIEKISSLKELIDTVEDFVDNNTDEQDIQKQREKYKNTNVPNEIISEIKNKCKQEINIDNSYYSFSKSLDACYNFTYNVAPAAYDGEVYFIFKCNTKGLDVMSLYNKIDQLDIDKEVIDKFKNAINDFGYQEEVICKISDPEVINFQTIDLNKDIDLLTLINTLHYDIY